MKISKVSYERWWVTALMLIGFNTYSQPYPTNYFRSPLNIPMQLVANFGEIRPNHWHMGLDIRTQHKVNLPVYAAADGYIARVSVNAGGFGQAIYIRHPNGYTTLYGHLNAFLPALATYMKQQQYSLSSWEVDLPIPPGLFPVNKGDQIAWSGSTGASEGPHLHFEIRNTETGNNVNPLLFGFPIADNVPPAPLRLAIYDRTKTAYNGPMHVYAIRRSGKAFTLNDATIQTTSNKISFAIGAVDYFNHSSNPNGIYSARMWVDSLALSGFVLDNISYDNTRYINAQVDYHYKSNGGGYVQHLSPLPGEKSGVYQVAKNNGVIELRDNNPHNILIEVADPNKNVARVFFSVRLIPSPKQPAKTETTELLVPNNINIIERENFEIATTEKSIYDTVAVVYHVTDNHAPNAMSPAYSFLDASIPVHDSVTVRVKPSTEIPKLWHDRLIIQNVSGTKTIIRKAVWQKSWLAASFRQFGSYQVFADTEPPVINPPGYGELIDLSKKKKIIFTPKDNFKTIKSFRAELDGQWLCFSNDKGRSWIYQFDEHFPKGEHALKVMVEDEAGNVAIKTWRVRR